MKTFYQSMNKQEPSSQLSKQKRCQTHTHHKIDPNGIYFGEVDPKQCKIGDLLPWYHLAQDTCWSDIKWSDANPGGQALGKKERGGCEYNLSQDV